MNVKVYNQEGQEAGTRELPKLFELPWNADLVHQVVTSQAANRRPTVAHTKGRGEVRGGGRKPWRQKGTGRARHGSIRSPIWKGGGVTHGPVREKQFKKKINKKMASRALATVLSAKIRDREVLLLTPLTFERAKTREAARAFANITRGAGTNDLTVKAGRALFLIGTGDGTLRRALGNLPFLKLESARNVTALDALNHKYLVIPTDALPALAERLGR